MTVTDPVANPAADYDVIVAGFGGAGAAAAIEAHDAGARVLVLEKAADGGGSTAESGGSFATVLDRDAAIEHYVAITEHRTPYEVIAAYVDGVLQFPQWLADNGYGTEPLPVGAPAFPRRYPGSAYRNKPHSGAIGERYRVYQDGVTHGGTSLWNALRESVERRGIEVRLGSEVSALWVEDGRVVGVETDGERLAAGGGVVLCTGGFGYSSDLLREHIGVDLPAFGPPRRNDGAGMQMALEAGAGLWHLNGLACGFGYRVPEVEAAWMCVMRTFGFVLVNQQGQRFLSEPTIEHHAANHALLVRDFHSGEFDRLPSYLVFDDRARRGGAIATNEAGANRVLAWSESNLEEVAKGWISRADTVADLAVELGVPPDALAATVQRYNAAAEDGTDEFGRLPSQMIPIDEPPYYGIAVWPALFNTQGGPRRGADGAVQDVRRNPIPGLFSAGELGSIWGSLYPGAGNVTEALVFGRIAGASAARACRPRPEGSR